MFAYNKPFPLRMSSAASLSGGKYTRDLKLRVLEHYFRNGGEYVFGNKQSTAKKFGVDNKSINRFLKIPDLVRMARKNARSNKPTGGPSGGFKVSDSESGRAVSGVGRVICFALTASRRNRPVMMHKFFF